MGEPMFMMGSFWFDVVCAVGRGGSQCRCFFRLSLMYIPGAFSIPGPTGYFRKSIETSPSLRTSEFDVLSIFIRSSKKNDARVGV